MQGTIYLIKNKFCKFVKCVECNQILLRFDVLDDKQGFAKKLELLCGYCENLGFNKEKLSTYILEKKPPIESRTVKIKISHSM